jgi:hypothetical protein
MNAPSYRPGQIVSVFDFRLQRWRRGVVKGATLEQVTIEVATDVLFKFHPRSPDVRAIRLAYARPHGRAMLATFETAGSAR